MEKGEIRNSLCISILPTGDGVTLFAPTNAAFAKLSQTAVARITSNPQTLAGKFTKLFCFVFLFHVKEQNQEKSFLNLNTIV